jgi:hypothetical protein
MKNAIKLSKELELPLVDYATQAPVCLEPKDQGSRFQPLTSPSN